jgi:tRNA threonylcarbamoyladenosine biosynthesis protein TsaE
MSETVEFITESARETKEVGIAIGKHLVPRSIVLLKGELGTGKTCLASGIAEGLGNPMKDHVMSPFYSILNIYKGNIPMYHFDLYRVNTVEELYDLSYDEYLYGEGITVIEWPEIILPLLESDPCLLIRFTLIDDSKRVLSILDEAGMYDNVIRELRGSLK